MSNYKELLVWKKAIKLSVDVYQIALTFPNDEKYGLNTQMKRAVISISSNIAEGAGRNSPKEFIQFLRVANGSCLELDSQIHVAYELKLISEQSFNELTFKTIEISKMIFSLKKSIKSKL